MPYRVYILLCADGSYYTGSAANVEARVVQHQEGVYPESYTFGRRPVKLIWCSDEVKRYSEALAFERQVKGWNRAKKEALIRGDFGQIHEIVKAERKRREKIKKKPSH
jgi:putative endonuclease